MNISTVSISVHIASSSFDTFIPHSIVDIYIYIYIYIYIIIYVHLLNRHF